MSGAQVVGLVLAGGRSTRFGGEKAAALLGGRPLLLWAAERLRSVCVVVAASVRPGSEAEALAQRNGMPVVHDAVGDAPGPLAGVKAGLLWAQARNASLLAISPCDAPLLPDDLYARLLEHGGDGAVLAETSSGRQPLCALWPVAALSTVSAALADGAHPPTWQVLEQIGARRVMFERAETFANVNTRDDLKALHARSLG